MTEQELFLQAISRPAGVERERFLHQACGPDQALRARLEELLQAHERESGFLDAPAFELPTTNLSRITEGPGSTVGPYRLLQRIGEGGFGVVYMAEQTEPVRRKVALKIIKPGMDTKEVIARFESERQALALMDHPNIARVLDAGATDSGRPYFVMELVKGVPITEFCDKNKFSVPDRLSLFVPICLAVQHAHHKGVIHRDIKPSNVMVTLHDGRPVPKVIDFGVAKATSQQLTQRTLFTAYGQMIGTPLYMSPEQAEMSGLDIDTRSDIYSLGVLLYELLTGTTPIEQKKLHEAGLLEMQRLIRDVEAPKPSTRLSTLHEEASIICSNRGTDAKRLGDLLKGDVDWIVMKALEKDRQRRYDTPTAFADDIQRFLSHEAIHARPPSTAYRVRKFVQRNRGLALGIGAVAATLLVGAFISTGFAFYANAQWRRALKAEGELQVSLTDAQRERKNAVDQQFVAEKERDRAVAAEQAQTELTHLAQQRFQEAERARMAEAEQRQLADQQRMEADRQKEEAVKLTTRLTQANEQQRRAIYASDMSLVRLEAQRGNLARMREILMDQLPIYGEEDLRGFEWHYWYRHLHQAQMLTKIDNFKYGRPDAAAILPAGNLMAVCRGQQQTELREIASGKVVSTLPEKLRLHVNRTQFSRTGRSIHGECDSQYSFVPRGTRPVTAASCTVYDPTGESHVFVYPDQSFSHLSYLNISPDGRRIVALGNALDHRTDRPASRLIVWDVDSKQLLLNQVEPHEWNRVEFSPDGTQLATYVCHSSRRRSNEERAVAAVIEVATGKSLGLARHNDDIDSVFWLRDQPRLLMVTLGFSGNLRKELRSWRISEGRPEVLARDLMPDYVKGVVEPQGRLIAIFSHTVASIRLFDTWRGDLVETLHNEGAAIDSLSFSEDGQRLIGLGTNGQVLSWSLERHRDLFALRSKPLPELVEGVYALSGDQMQLAVACADGAILLRSRNGGETRLRGPIPGFSGTGGKLTFSTDGRFLAHCSYAVASERTRPRSSQDSSSANSFRLTVGVRTLEMYDLTVGSRLWQTEESHRFYYTLSRPDYPFREKIQLVFNSDGGHLFCLEQFRGATVMRTLTGEIVNQPLSTGEVRLRTHEFVMRRSDQRLLAVASDIARSSEAPDNPVPKLTSSRTVVLDAITGEAVAEPREAGSEYSVSGQRVLAGLPTLAPDGVHLGVVRVVLKEAQIWRLPEEKLLVSAPGSQIVFSDDGKTAAILQRESRELQLGFNPPLGSVRDITLWDLPSGRQLSRISLAGSLADGIRFSPDGRRVLSLHGQGLVSTAGWTAAAGRLWDVETGKELLSVPVAEQNHYAWEMLFDPSGLKLTRLVFGKVHSAGGEGDSLTYDATPLSAEEDARLVANRLLELLLKRTPVPAELVQEINSLKTLKPLIRQAALAAVARLGPNSDQMAETCLDLLTTTFGSADTNQKLLRWAETLHTQEPESIRSRAILGAAQCENEQYGTAIKTLSSLPKATESTAEFVHLGQAYLLLARHRAGVVPPEAPELDAGEVLSLIRGSTLLRGLPRIALELERLPQRDRAATSAVIQSSRETVDRNNFHTFDKNGDGKLAEFDAFWGANASWGAYRQFDENSDDALDVEEYLVARRVGRLLSANNSENSDPAKFLANLTAAIQLAPNYTYALTKRAWLLATLPEDRLRDGDQAVQDAVRANQLTNWRDPSNLDTLAAAHAAAGNFEEAVKWAEQAVDRATVTTLHQFRERLTLYRQRKPYRQNSASNQIPVGGGQSFSGRISSAPLIAPDIAGLSRRISGWSAAWSPDSRKIVRNVTNRKGSGSNLEIVDLQTGETTLLSQGGHDAAWSKAPGEKIAFAQFAKDKPGQMSAEQLWLVNPDGSGLQELTEGGFPAWTRDHRLYYRKLLDDKSPWLFCVDPATPESPQWSGGLDVALHPAVSPDGSMMVRIVPGRLSIQRLNPPADLVSWPLGSPTELGLADFSPDGKYVVYSSRDPANSSSQSQGIWLIEVATGHGRLLMEGNSTNPRWSPDGKFISVEKREDKEILLLDISQLDLTQGLKQVRPVPVKFGGESAPQPAAAEGRPAP